MGEPKPHDVRRARPLRLLAADLRAVARAPGAAALPTRSP